MDTTAATRNDIDSLSIVNINDDCLREIFKYLNVVDAFNAASACNRLRCFANEHHYKKFINIELKPDVKSKEKERLITATFLRTMVQHFGNIIEEIYVDGATLTYFGGYHHLQCLLELCPNLHTLRIRNCGFFGRPTSNLSNICSSSGIKVFEISECEVLDKDFFLNKVIMNFYKLRSLIIKESSLGLFSREFKNLKSLELHDYPFEVRDFAKFCENNGATMRKLKLMNCPTLHLSVFPMISKNLQRIEELAIDINFMTRPYKLYCLSKLNHLKKLVIVCGEQYNIGQCMIWLGNRGLLELLDIYGGALDAETCGTLKNFQRLQTLRLLYPMSEDKLMMDIIVNADLPELRVFYCEACNSITDANLVAMVKSKRNLTTVDILFNKSVTFAAVLQIIDDLRSDLDGDRPHLKLNIDTIELGEEEVKVLNANRHIITLTNVTKSSKIIRKSVEYDEKSIEDFECEQYELLIFNFS